MAGFRAHYGAQTIVCCDDNDSSLGRDRDLDKPTWVSCFVRHISGLLTLFFQVSQRLGVLVRPFLLYYFPCAHGSPQGI
jgi:hypothetical protein